MPFVTHVRFANAMYKTHMVLDGIVANLTQEDALAATDGPDGWSVVEVVCHLLDFEKIARRRVDLILTKDNPDLPRFDHEGDAIAHDYKHQVLAKVWAELRAERERSIALYTSLTDEQAARTGIHPEMGLMNVTDIALQTPLHDVDHLQQITRCLGRTAMPAP